MSQFATLPSATLASASSTTDEVRPQRRREPAATDHREPANAAVRTWTQLAKAWRDDAQVYGGAIDSPLFANV